MGVEEGEEGLPAFPALEAAALPPPEQPASLPSFGEFRQAGQLMRAACRRSVHLSLHLWVLSSERPQGLSQDKRVPSLEFLYFPVERLLIL